jgi:hypothetical protein
MRQERVLQVLLVLIGLFFVAGIYPLLTSLPQHQQSDYGDQMMLAVYFVARRISANGCAKAGGSSQSDFLRRMGTLAQNPSMSLTAIFRPLTCELTRSLV